VSINEQVREANFVQLTKYLKDNKLSISKDEFKAVLFAMNGMTVYDMTKMNAINKASEKFSVTKKFVKDMIAKLNIVSDRYLKNKKEFGRTQAIIAQDYKRALKQI